MENNKFQQVHLPRAVAALLAAATGIPMCDSAVAQENTVIEEVLVTATRRSKALQDVPFSIQALNTEALENLGADSIEDYFRTISSFSMVDLGPGTKKYAIRGTSTGVYSQSAATVGVYIDEMPITTTQDQPDLRLFDVERVEVLKGPQGTLFGEGSMGGTVRTITNKPDLSAISGKLAATLSDTSNGGDNRSFDAMLNLPLVDNQLALRLVAYHRGMSGFIDRVAQPDGVTLDPAPGIGLPPGLLPTYNTGPIAGRENINEEKTSGGRASLRWTPNDRLSLTGTWLTQSMEVDAWPYENADAGEYRSDFVIESPIDDEFDMFNVTVEYSFDSFDLLSSSSWFDREKYDEQNTSTFTEFAFWPGVTTAGSGTTNARDQQYFSQEIRFVSRTDSRLQWIAGGFYADREAVTDQRLRDDFDFFFNFLNETFFPFVGPDLGIPPGFGVSSMNQILDTTTTQKSEDYALFGEISYAVTERLTATFGTRYFDYQLETVQLNNDINVLGFGSPDGQYDTDGSGSIEKYHLQYDFNDDVLVYVMASEGFRLGGVNTAPLLPPEFVSFDSDSLWSYEAGVKSTFFNGRLLADFAAFHTDWQDIQLSIPVGVTRAIANAGDAEIRGVEFSLVARPVAGLELQLTGGLLNAELSEDTPFQEGDTSPGFKGDPLPTVPEETLSASAQYEFPLGKWGLNGFARADYSYTGEHQTTFNELTVNNAGQSNFFTMDAYSLLNLQLGVRSDSWQATLFVENARDERAQLLIDNNASETLITRNRPRTAGITIQYAW